MTQYKDILFGLYNFLEFDLSKELLSKNIETKRLFFLQQLSSLGISPPPLQSPTKRALEESNLQKRLSLPVITNSNNKLINNYGHMDIVNNDSEDSYNQETIRPDSRFHSKEYLVEEDIYETPISPGINNCERNHTDYDNHSNCNNNGNNNNTTYDGQATISKNSAMLLPRKSFLHTRRLSINNSNDCSWTLLGSLKHRVKNNKWIKMNTCILLSNARLIAFKTYPVKSTLFTTNTNWTSSANICIYLCGAHGLYAARDSGMNHVIKISAPGTNYETHVFAADNEQQALIWTDQINQYATGNVPSHSFSFLDKDLVSTFTTMPTSLHQPVTYIVSKDRISLEASDTSLNTISQQSPNSHTKTTFPLRRDPEGLTRRFTGYDSNLFHNMEFNLDESQENISNLKSNSAKTVASHYDTKSQFNKRSSLLSSVRRKMEQQFPSKRRLSVQQFQHSSDLMSEHSKKSMTISGPSNQSSPKLPTSTSNTYEYPNYPLNFHNSRTGLNWSQLSVGGHIFLRKSSYSSQTNLNPSSPCPSSSATESKFGSPSLYKKDGSLTPSVRIRTSLRRASLSAFKFNQSSSISDLSNRHNRSFEQNDDSLYNGFVKDPDELISGEAQICIPDQTPWTTRWCSLKTDYLNIYSTPTRPCASQINKPIFSLTLKPGLVHLELANDKRYRAAIKLSAPSLSNKSLFFNISDKIIIGAWIRGFIQALGMIKTSQNQRTHLNLVNINCLTKHNSLEEQSTDLDSPIYSEVSVPPRPDRCLAKEDDLCSNIRPFSMIETNYDTDLEKDEESSPVYDEVFHIHQTSLPVEIPSCYTSQEDEDPSRTLYQKRMTHLPHHMERLNVSKTPMKTPTADPGLRKASSVESFPKRPSPAKSIVKRLNEAHARSTQFLDQLQEPSNLSLEHNTATIRPENCIASTQDKEEQEIYDEIPSSLSTGVTVGRSISCKCPVLNYGRNEIALMLEQLTSKCISNTLPTLNSRTSTSLCPTTEESSDPRSRASKNPLPFKGARSQFYSTSASSFYSSSLSSRTAASSGIPLNHSEDNTRPPSSSFGGMNSFTDETGSMTKLGQTESVYCNEEFSPLNDLVNHEFDHDYASRTDSNSSNLLATLQPKCSNLVKSTQNPVTSSSAYQDANSVYLNPTELCPQSNQENICKTPTADSEKSNQHKIKSAIESRTDTHYPDEQLSILNEKYH